MAQQIINLGTTANDGTGDSGRSGGDKVNDNFTEVYHQAGMPWDAARAYLANDFAKVNSTVYIAQAPSTNIDPTTDTDYSHWKPANLAELSSYNNTTSGATATNVQTALDEAFGTMVNLTGDQTITGVKTFNKTIQSPLGSSYVGGAILVNGLSAVFTNATNNINAVGIGIGVEVGDVIQISGSTNNNGEFTVEVITDANNVIVNQAHAGKSRTVAPIGTKALINETATVTVKLLCKWYLAPSGLGQGWVNVTSSRALEALYVPPANRSIEISVACVLNSANSVGYVIDGVLLRGAWASGAGTWSVFESKVTKGSTYKVNANLVESIFTWSELR